MPCNATGFFAVLVSDQIILECHCEHLFYPGTLKQQPKTDSACYLGLRFDGCQNLLQRYACLDVYGNIFY
jgi:hypothetical protein